MIFVITEIYNFEPYNVLLVISTNIAVLLMTASVLQRHVTFIYTAFLTIQIMSKQLYSIK